MPLTAKRWAVPSAQTAGGQAPNIQNRDVRDNAGRRWTVGSIANGHVLTAEAGWVRLNARELRGAMAAGRRRRGIGVQG
jgi:hypothetical protein